MSTLYGQAPHLRRQTRRDVDTHRRGPKNCSGPPASTRETGNPGASSLNAWEHRGMEVSERRGFWRKLQNRLEQQIGNIGHATRKALPPPITI